MDASNPVHGSEINTGANNLFSESIEGVRNHGSSNSSNTQFTNTSIPTGIAEMSRPPRIPTNSLLLEPFGASDAQSPQTQSSITDQSQDKDGTLSDAEQAGRAASKRARVAGNWPAVASGATSSHYPNEALASNSAPDAYGVPPASATSWQGRMADAIQERARAQRQSRSEGEDFSQGTDNDYGKSCLSLIYYLG